jgi:predicted amidohydrolase
MRGVRELPRTTEGMLRSIRVAAVQLRAVDRNDFSKGLAGILDDVDRASAQAELVVVPEGTFPAYVLGPEPLDYAQLEAAIDSLRVIARERRAVIVAGAAALRDGSPRNGAVVIDADGSLAGCADKLFLWHFDRLWFVRGERLAPITTRVGSIGVLICADGRLPTISRALVDGGAEALVMPTAWVTSGRNPEALENVQADLLARVRAYENRVPFVAANKCGAERAMVAYCGKSQIIDANGELVALAGEREPETLHGTVTMGLDRPVRVQPANPAARAERPAHPLRLAISYDPLPKDIDERLELLEDAYAISPADHDRLASLDRVVALACVDDATVLDPGGLVPYRRSGYAVICWSTSVAEPWLQRLARARAVELRLYIVVFDSTARRAFAVDPDGAIVAGTFGDYRLASFSFDARKTQETLVAPGTDVALGLDHVAAVTARNSPF